MATNNNKMENLTKQEQDTKQVYINSFEAADIYDNKHRDIKLDFDYLGMIPYSLELIKLRQVGLKIKSLKTSNREFSDDIINVRFKHITEDLTERTKKIITKFGGNNYVEFKRKLDNKITGLKEQSKPIAGESSDEKKRRSDIRKQVKYLKKMIVKMNSDELRKLFYLNGFDFNGINYVHYKRSAAKSRQGQCLFIREDLHDEMISWSRMRIDFPKNGKIDLARLLSSECLVSTSIERTIQIDPRHILLIEDIERPISTTANVISMGKEHLESHLKDNVKIDNCLTDGEALLDSSLFEDGQSMMLLRNHFFKAAAFATNFKKFFEDHQEIKTVENMFHEPINVDDIELVVTPSCCKFLKFADVLGSEKEMWDYWVKLVKSEGKMFGVCKHEKESKYRDENGKPIQRTSYQMINSLDANKEEIAELCQWELNYINGLQNNDEAYIQYLEDTKNQMNSNEMMIALYRKNPEIVGTKIFREYRTHKVSEYKKIVRRGKIKLAGDYCILAGNIITYLYSVISQEPIHELKNNECYCTMFTDNQEVAAFRNPHTSPSNIVVLKNNRSIDEMEKYFKLSENIVAVNAYNFPLQRHLSGCDYDSDTAVLFSDSDKKIVEIANRSFGKGKYPVCVNGVGGEKTEYQLCLDDEYTIDSKLKNSQTLIGEVVNSCQQVMSRYWDQEGKDKTLLDAVNVATVLSEICIDLAKKYYPIKFKKEINYLKSLTWDLLDAITDNNGKEIKSYDKRVANFWKYVKEDMTDDKMKPMNCPMDYLEEVIDTIKKADSHKDMSLLNIIVNNKNKQEADRKQINNIVQTIADHQDYVKKVMADKDISDKTKTIKRTLASEEVRRYVEKLKIKDGTMETILYRIAKGEKKISNPTAVLNVMYQIHKKRFMEYFI